MSNYDSDEDSSSNDPVLIGMPGFDCATCQSTTVPLYSLTCHEKYELYCRNCLTMEWYKSSDEIVPCPDTDCELRFHAPQTLSQELQLDHRFYDAERIDVIRQQLEDMNNLIAFTREEAEITLPHVYSLFEDQILDLIALGGVPGHIKNGSYNSLQANFDLNPFYIGLLQELTAAPKLMSTPYEFEEDLNNVLSRLLHGYANHCYGNELARWSVDMNHEEAVLSAALENYKPIKDLKGYLEEIIQKWVDLLAWRH